MLSFTDYRSGDFGHTATYARREFCWVPAYPSARAKTRLLGRLTIKLQPHERRYFKARGVAPEGDEPQTLRAGRPSAVDIDTYLVEEIDYPEPGDHGGRAFWLVNKTDPDQQEPYRCVVGGLTPHCNCDGGVCNKHPDLTRTQGCKHKDVLTHLIAEGILDKPAREPGVGASDEPDDDCYAIVPAAVWGAEDDADYIEDTAAHPERSGLWCEDELPSQAELDAAARELVWLSSPEPVTV